ncbi:MAG: cell division protein FtsW [Alphaproteobacteria bacterium]|nr:MAG: cell division protein FtsW [Alphaproteobacteria bacterium]
MIGVPRTDTSILGRWWWTVDRWTLAALIALMAIGAMLILTVSPAAAERIGGLGAFQLAQRQIAYLSLALATMIGVSLLEPRAVRRLAIVGMITTLGLLVLTLLVGPEIKGATRWLSIAGVSFQPSEFAKPFFAVTAAWLIAAHKTDPRVPGLWLAGGLWLALTALLLLQPDFGQSVVVGAVWGLQLFLAGLPLVWIGILAAFGIFGLVGAYLTLPHVAARIDRFLDPAAGDQYQIARSMEAFMNGGLFGRGPGEGRIKALLPDAHSDFIFAVAGEELGAIACLVIVALFAFIVLRGFARLFNESSLFTLVACTGLFAQFGIQALINMASALHLIPTKGMTLPFISYGGSSLIALGLGMGMVLAFTRRRIGAGGVP